MRCGKQPGIVDDYKDGPVLVFTAKEVETQIAARRVTA